MGHSFQRYGVDNTWYGLQNKLNVDQLPDKTNSLEPTVMSEGHLRSTGTKAVCAALQHCHLFNFTSNEKQSAHPERNMTPTEELVNMLTLLHKYSLHLGQFRFSLPPQLPSSFHLPNSCFFKLILFALLPNHPCFRGTLRR
jgi:hypothetical protein